jgi:hypothetical protein
MRETEEEARKKWPEGELVGRMDGKERGRNFLDCNYV